MRRLLDAGFTVHGAVRDARKGEELRAVFAQEAQERRFRVVIVPDIRVVSAACGLGLASR